MRKILPQQRAKIASPLAGLLIDKFGTSAYRSVFVLGMCLAAVSMIGFACLVREPRKGEHLITQVIKRP